MDYRSIYNEIKDLTDNFTELRGFYFAKNKNDQEVAFNILNNEYDSVKKQGLDYSGDKPDGRSYKIEFSKPKLEEDSGLEFIDNKSPDVANQGPLGTLSGGIGEGLKEDNIMIKEAIEKHDELNPDLWDENHELFPEVKDKIEEIVKKFTDNLKENEIELDIKDVAIIGSNANYNYTPNSDIDVHIIADTSVYPNQEELALKLYMAYKSIFNSKYDPIIRNHEVEVYVEPDKVHANSNGIYSLYNGWLKEPEKTDVPEVDMDEVNKNLEPFEQRFNEVIAGESIEDIDKLIDDIYLQRQTSILKDGEFGIGNLTFKEFRNRGRLQDLRARKLELENKELSLEGLEETYSPVLNSILEEFDDAEYLDEDVSLYTGQVLVEPLTNSKLEILDISDDLVTYVARSEDAEPAEYTDYLPYVLATVKEYGYKDINEDCKKEKVEEQVNIYDEFGSYLNTVNEELNESVERIGNGVEFKFPDIRDTLSVYCTWEGIIGFEDDLMDYAELEDSDELRAFLDDNGIYGYTTDIYDILHGEPAYCKEMDLEDFRNICDDLALDYELALNEASRYDYKDYKRIERVSRDWPEFKVVDSFGNVFRVKSGNFKTIDDVKKAYPSAKKITLVENLDEAKNNKVYKVIKYDYSGREHSFEGTLEELIDKFSYTLMKGKSWENEKGNHKINTNPKNIDSLINNLNWSVNNAAANGYSNTFYELAEDDNLREGYTRLSRKFDIFEDAKKFAAFLDNDLEPRIEQFDTEKDGNIITWYEVNYWDPTDLGEDDLDEDLLKESVGFFSVILDSTNKNYEDDVEGLKRHYGAKRVLNTTGLKEGEHLYTFTVEDTSVGGVKADRQNILKYLEFNCDSFVRANDFDKIRESLDDLLPLKGKPTDEILDELLHYNLENPSLDLGRMITNELVDGILEDVKDIKIGNKEWKRSESGAGVEYFRDGKLIYTGTLTSMGNDIADELLKDKGSIASYLNELCRDLPRDEIDHLLFLNHKYHNISTEIYDELCDRYNLNESRYDLLDKRGYPIGSYHDKEQARKAAKEKENELGQIVIHDKDSIKSYKIDEGTAFDSMAGFMSPEEIRALEKSKEAELKAEKEKIRADKAEERKRLAKAERAREKQRKLAKEVEKLSYYSLADILNDVAGRNEETGGDAYDLSEDEVLAHLRSIMSDAEILKKHKEMFESLSEDKFIYSIDDIKYEFQKMIDKHPEWTKEKAIDFAGDILRDKGVSYKDLLIAKEEFEDNLDEEFEVGDVYENENGVIVKIIEPTVDGDIQWEFRKSLEDAPNDIRKASPKALKKMLDDNGYTKIITFDQAVALHNDPSTYKFKVWDRLNDPVAERRYYVETGDKGSYFDDVDEAQRFLAQVLNMPASTKFEIYTKEVNEDMQEKDNMKVKKLEEKVINEASDSEDDRVRALANYLGVDVDDIDDGYESGTYEVNGEAYFVGTQDEAYDKAVEEIKMIYDDLGLDSFSSNFQEYVLYNCLDQSEVDEFVENEIDYWTYEEPDEDRVEYLEGLSDSEKIGFIQDMLGESEFNRWAEDKIDLDEVAEEAISQDGVEHFVARYDGNEIELENNLYAYRVD